MFCILVFNVAEPLKYSYDYDPSDGLRSLDRDHSATRDKIVQVLRRRLHGDLRACYGNLGF